MSYIHVDDRQYITVATEPPAPVFDEKNRAAISAGEGDRATKRRTGTISVLLVDDHALIREGLRQLFALEPDLQVIDEAVDGLDALLKVRQWRPDVVLMDIHLPVVDGITLTREITRAFPSTAIIILTAYQQQQQMLQAIKNGARGYLLKSASAREVAQAIRMVHEDGVFIKPEMTSVLVSEFRRLSGPMSSGEGIDALAEKEIEIVRYVAAGMSNKEIAEKLVYSEKTVKNYLSLIFQKLHLRDRTQVAIFALRHGLLPEEEN
ncbi:MAG TPA: response regulator transcription factor [Ktedonobacteraceae bacterium]|jgi:DNA-binding NarL/FixJ family response regulator|nr:response regulator transcription factor [Ktedonobacteraceae bacterium]